MTDTDGGGSGQGGLPVVTSLEGSAAQAKTVAESWIADPQSPYWRGDAAASIRGEYRDLLRGELQGAAGAVAPPDGVDGDLPMSIAKYDFSQSAGAASMTADDRAIIDSFLPVAFAAGIGQQKVQQVIGWSLAIPGLTAERFTQLARTAGWSDGAIKACLSWYRTEAARRGPSGRSTATAAPQQRSAIAARKAEIEAQMWIGDKPNPAYFGSQLQIEYNALLRAEGFA